MREGYYMIQFVGAAGWGMGMLVLDTGVVSGADTEGGIIDGAYAYDPRKDAIQIDVTWTATQTTQMVQGKTVPAGFSMPVSLALPKKPLTKVEHKVTTPIGEITLVFQKVRDFNP